MIQRFHGDVPEPTASEGQENGHRDSLETNHRGSR